LKTISICHLWRYKSQIIAKTKTETDSGTGKERRISEKSKNEMMREMTERTVKKHVKFGYILADSWFAPAENMRFIEKKGKTFVFEINDNRLGAASGQEWEKAILPGQTRWGTGAGIFKGFAISGNRVVQKLQFPNNFR
jgi:hypothetical protein